MIFPERRFEMRNFNKIAKRIDSFRDDMIEMQTKLCSIPAIAPTSGGEGEVKKAEFLLSFLKKMRFDQVDLIKAPDMDAPSNYRPNILAVYKGKKSAKTIWVMTHLDVVPPGELSLWDGNPFKAWIKEGKIYGRGTEDNQQDMVASLFALKSFEVEGIQPQYDVGIVLVADEETGSEKGIDYVLNNTNAFRHSLLWLKFRTLGKQAHGSTPEKGINSFRAASFLVTELSKLYTLYPNQDPLFEPPISTFEPTKKESNVPNVNTIPGEDIFYMDSRILPEYPLQKVQESIQKMCRKTEKKFNVKITVKEEQKAPAAPPTPADAAVVQALKKAIKAVYNKEGQAVGIGGGTVAALFRKANFEAACWAKLDETAHQPNEYCIIDNMLGDAKVFAHIFLQD